MTTKITTLVDHRAREGFMAEFGLSLLVESEGQRILFDTGAGKALERNAATLGVDLSAITRVVLSHGHYDHATGLASLRPKVPVHVGKGVELPCFSVHEDGECHRISMPEASRKVLEGCDCREVRGFTEVSPGVFLTGPIARESGEDAGGAFFQDESRSVPNAVPEEISMLLEDGGVLVTGCCHAGLINTLQACRRFMPAVPVKTIVGGLHLAHADEQRLSTTADYLASMPGLRRMVLMHCTGDEAGNFLKDWLDGAVEVAWGQAGDVLELKE